MRILYTSTLCVSSERAPACGQILPILQKLEGHFKVQDADSAFTAAIKKRVWDDLSKRYTVCILLLLLLLCCSKSVKYIMKGSNHWHINCLLQQDEEIRMFLEEATLLDPRFKTKILDAAVWSRLEEKACGDNSEQVCYIHFDYCYCTFWDEDIDY